MRIALCFSGHFRTFPVIWETWKEHLLQYHDVDVFCHMWDRIGPALKATTPEKNTDGVVGSELISIDLVRDLCNPVDLVVERYDTKVEAFKRKAAPMYAAVERLGLSRVNQPTANFSMYYKQWQCNQLKRLHEKLHRFRYDIVIRTRFDVQINNSLSKAILDDLTKVWTSTNAPGGTMHAEVNDICLVTNSRNMDIMTNIYLTWARKLKVYEKGGEAYNAIQPHLMFARHITDNGLTSHKTPELNVRIVR